MDPSFQGPQIQDVVPMLLATARFKISQGDPSSALQAVIAALRACGGEQTVLQTLARARDVYQNRLRTNAAADELAALFAECAIIEANAAVPINSSPESNMMDIGHQSVNFGNLDIVTTMSNEVAPILAESGRMQIVLDASADGSSFICLQCGGLVSNLRRDEHLAYWCTHTFS